jgi:protein TonB
MCVSGGVEDGRPGSVKVSAVENRAGPPTKVAPIRFQPLLPQPAHPGRSLLAWGVPAALLEFLGVAALLVITAAGPTVEPEAVTVMHFVELPPEVALPTPPPPPEAPPPLMPQSDAPKEVLGFQELAMPTITLSEIPPPALGTPTLRSIDFTGEGALGGRGLVATADTMPDPIEAGPTFTPYTVAPWLKNGPAVARTLAREYPAPLRDAGIGGQVLLWLLIDQTGTVDRALVKTSSGFEALDAAAMRVAVTMEFTPALNRDRRIPVWVAIPVDFTVR